MKKKVAIGNKKPLVKDILFAEGITRSGKFLLANILAGFAGVEPVQSYTLIDDIPVLIKIGLVDKRTAEELLRREIDIHCYEMYIGRILNHRLSDKSSIFNYPRHKEFLTRCALPDGDAAIARFYKEKPCSFFIVHEGMPNIDTYFSILPQLKVIHIRRSPVDLVLSLYKRGYGRRLGGDPRFFDIPFKAGKEFFPWYIYPHQKEYCKLSEMDRVIFSVICLFRLYKNKYRALSEPVKKKILTVSYENLMFEPRETINRMAVFLKRAPLPQMSSILKRERLPKPRYLDSKDEKIGEIKKYASSEYFNALTKLEQEYFAHHDQR